MPRKVAGSALVKRPRRRSPAKAVPANGGRVRLALDEGAEGQEHPAALLGGPLRHLAGVAGEPVDQLGDARAVGGGVEQRQQHDGPPADGGVEVAPGLALDVLDLGQPGQQLAEGPRVAHRGVGGGEQRPRFGPQLGGVLLAQEVHGAEVGAVGVVRPRPRGARQHVEGVDGPLQLVGAVLLLLLGQAGDVVEGVVEQGVGHRVPGPPRLDQEVGGVDAGPGLGGVALRPQREAAVVELQEGDPAHRVLHHHRRDRRAPAPPSSAAPPARGRAAWRGRPGRPAGRRRRRSARGSRRGSGGARGACRRTGPAAGRRSAARGAASPAGSARGRRAAGGWPRRRGRRSPRRPPPAGPSAPARPPTPSPARRCPRR